MFGNYYQYNTAVAGTGVDITNQRATNSICPKNWKLPSADGGAARSATEIVEMSDYVAKYGETFTKLFTSYGFEFPSGANSGTYGAAIQANYNIATAPFYFVRAGYIALNTGSLRDLGLSGDYTSSMTSTSRNDYYLHISGASTFPSSQYYRWRGYPIRCLAR